jgi:hypothetical protein
MNMPGFTAQASLLQTSKSYYSSNRSASTTGAVYPAFCSWPCYSNCRATCTTACLDGSLFGAAKGACLRECAADCREGCGC